MPGSASGPGSEEGCREDDDGELCGPGRSLRALVNGDKSGRRPHAWRAVSTIALLRGRAYPGIAAVRSAGDDRCRDLVRDLVDDPLSFRFGWEWPTRDQWRAGQRHGYCWAPD